ncbi:3-ketoacyl-ACP reductase [Paraburkholderia metrosideri]|uniref:3-oxoacyl-[acyl-carrier-protein] reductase FabG n=1 Tax=Paraburkholderia metrosideri TaxID=580937 RepID=A0ABN7HLL1_9BURK|nr:3-ketoacyl-ACP reductase [Paraburkholderia metrosideri]CAD6526039.1 3-oxoacyl-[acyl-carrier-protein] reductase FabG [Paraburkholderia metrosideri]
MQQRQVALVTGARRGIGRAIALELANAGFDVAITDVETSEELIATRGDIERIGVKCIALTSNLADIARQGALFDSVEQALGPVTCLVNNAGVSVMLRGDLLDVTPESYDRCLNVNTRGTFFLMQAFGRRIARAPQSHVNRSIITITSSNAVAAAPERSEYCVSKAGLSMATTLFSLRLAELGVSVFEVQPGLIETEMTAPSKARYDTLINNGLTAIRRWGTPDEVALTVRTLATGGLPFSVGQAIRVDGGLLVSKY